MHKHSSPSASRLSMVAKDSANTPTLALCPRCHFPINPRKCFNVDFCMPAQLPPPPPTTPANHVPDRRRPRKDEPPSSPQPEDGRPLLLPEPPSSSRPQERSQNVASLPASSSTKVTGPAPSKRNKKRRSSTASTDYFAEFDRLSINTEFDAALRQTEAEYFPQNTSETPASPPTSSPSTESSLILSTSGEPVPLPVGRCWVVFRGHLPGIYRTLYVFHTSCPHFLVLTSLSSAGATEQTDGFPDAFMLAFEDPAQANDAFNRFLEHGIIPARGRGPWVVFVGRRQGVFTS